MVVEFDLPHGAPGELIVVRETDDGNLLFEQAAHRLGQVHTLAIGDRTWGETVIHLLHVFSRPRLVNGGPLVNRLRRVKSAEELAIMERACVIAAEAMAATTARVRSGVTMHELAEEVEHQMRVRGSRTPSFTTHIWTLGLQDSHDSHDVSGAQPLGPGEAVLFDFGAVVDGYCSDFGRTIFCGEPSSEYRRAYEVMLAAQSAGLAALKPGVTAAEANRACREPIEDAGYGPAFRHRMGHGIGLDVHERPFLSPEDETPLELGMTFTDEPSIIQPGKLGLRIEDVVVCDEGGGRKLYPYSAEMIVSM
jgi:Xaa-Pro aminopeptidase